MIVPTVGRIVWFMYNNTVEPLPAIVVHVHAPDESIGRKTYELGLSVFDAQNHYESYVPLKQEEDKDEDFVTRYAMWMPYQQKAAAKYPV